MQPIAPSHTPSGELVERDIHLWAVQLGTAKDVVERCQAILSPDEMIRESRFRFEHLRREFAVSRGVLRSLLSHYLSVPAAELRFSYGTRGKPSLVGTELDLRFNSSRSGNIALYSITRQCEVGIDVEQVRALQDVEQLACRAFCTEEVADLLSLPAVDRESAFFRCWTRKEAYVKAVGGGLSTPLDSFRVALKPGDRITFMHIDGDPDEARTWQLHEVLPAPGYISALAYRDSPRPLLARPIMSAGELLTVLAKENRQL